MTDKTDVPPRDPVAAQKPVLVKTDGYQCLAYQDSQGNWRTFYGGELLPGNVEVMPDG